MERSNIDLVIPMVFPQDPEWRREYERHRGGDVARHVRYRSWGTEELLVRCVMKYMPWLRRTIILLAQESQVQPWMRQLLTIDHSPLAIVFHREFIPEKYLPCFASPCIEMFLKDIPGLSEQFIYANDDMFPLSPLSPEDFFRRPTAQPIQETNPMPLQIEANSMSLPGLLPCQHITDRAYPANPGMFQRKCMWQQNMIGKPFGLHFTKTYTDTGHIFLSILKSSCEEVWRRHGEEIAGHLSPLRRTDRSANSWIYQLYQQFTGRYVDYRPPRHYTDQNTTTKRLVEIIRSPKAGVVCINDNENIADWRQRAEIVRREIERKLTG